MSIFFGNSLLKMAPEDDKGGGGGAPDAAKELATLKESNAALLARLDALEKAGKPPAKVEDDGEDPLAKKARLEREQNDKKGTETQVLTKAIKFNHTTKDFVKTNASLLPKSIEGIIAVADKEIYANEIEKSSAIQLSIVSEFFAQQENLDLLTESQKITLEEFKKLTKNVRQERVQAIYDSIFEPTLESLRKIKKAEALQKGLATPNGTEDAYTKKLVEHSTKHHIRERK